MAEIIKKTKKNFNKAPQQFRNQRLKVVAKQLSR